MQTPDKLTHMALLMGALKYAVRDYELKNGIHAKRLLISDLIYKKTHGDLKQACEELILSADSYFLKQRQKLKGILEDIQKLEVKR